jgi:hypothetical protein
VKFPCLIRDKRTRWIHLTEPRLLEFGAVDNVMPFWPWTVWIYFTEYAFFVYAYFWLNDLRLVTRYYYAYMAILLFSITVFLLFPVTFPRDSYPAIGDSISVSALNFLRMYMDAPANCLPSLHVSSCFISSLCFWQESRWRAVLLSLQSCLVAISTMTTKQHYFVDVWTAMILTGVCYWFFFYKVELSGAGNAEGAIR